MDVFPPEARARIMAQVRAKDTKPEMTVRRLVHALGYRYRLHRKDLPGAPDLVFPGRRKVIFVHGCFWHGHDCSRGARVPKTNTEYWRTKIERNRVRDAKALRDLRVLGWETNVIWECELSDIEALARRLKAFLSQPVKSPF